MVWGHKTVILTHADNHTQSLSALHPKHTHTVYDLLGLGNCLCPLSPQVFLPDLRDDVVGFFERLKEKKTNKPENRQLNRRT